MIIIPPENTIITNLNSYYLNMERMIEHYQSELGTGSIYLKSPSAAGTIFFDEETILNVFFQDKDDWLDGKNARDRLIMALKELNFSVSVYKIEPARLYYWANLSYAEDFYRDLSTKFSDLEGLIKKMRAEKLTGYIDVSISGSADGGIVYLNNGSIIGSSCSWDKNGQYGSKNNLQQLMMKSKDSGGIFSVKQIDLKNVRRNSVSGTKTQKVSSRMLVMIQDLLRILETFVSGNKKIKIDFETLLKKKFVEKADTYEFLDPFAAEFQYAKGRVEFSGDAAPEQLVKAILESVMELADELGILTLLSKHLETWKKRYTPEIVKYRIEL
ncbi:hypothetical protein ACFL0M_04760 [Thermodesulfobacteriota bacterium]